MKQTRTPPRRETTLGLSAGLAASLAAAIAGAAFASPDKPGQSESKINADLADAERLSTPEINQTFSDVRDEAEVRDSKGTRAVNHWYSDGRFSNEWTSPGASGTVTGTWRAEADKRCIVIQSGLPERIGKESCSPLYRRGDVYFSINADGSIHGAHKLTPLSAAKP